MLCGTRAISARSVGICDGVPSTARSSLFMYSSYSCQNVWKENDGGTDNNPKQDLDNINAYSKFG